MTDFNDSAETQVEKLKRMIAESEALAKKMRELIAELEKKTRESKDDHAGKKKGKSGRE